MAKNMSQVFVEIEAVGGSSGQRWVYKPETAIKQITITHGDVIDSLIFKCQDGHQSPKFGGEGGDATDLVEINTPVEYLTAISGTVGIFSGLEVIKSLQFHTNMSSYGPFGRGGGSPFSMPSDGSDCDCDCSLVGFHGRSGLYLDAIGAYARPPSLPVIPKPVKFNMSLLSDAIAGLSPGNPGPFGGVFGREWDDGVLTSIIKILVHVYDDVNAIRCVRFEYGTGEDGNGSFWSPRHGNASLPRLVMHRVCSFTPITI